MKSKHVGLGIIIQIIVVAFLFATYKSLTGIFMNGLLMVAYFVVSIIGFIVWLIMSNSIGYYVEKYIDTSFKE